MNEVNRYEGRPTVEQLENEIKRREMARTSRAKLWGGLRTLIIFAAAAVLLTTFLLPVIRVQQSSMAPTLMEGELLVILTTGEVERGDIIALHHHDKLLLKRVVAIDGDWIDIDEDGIVIINDKQLPEPYLSELSRGSVTIALPLQVPPNQFFVMGDSRETSLDSRQKDIGTIHKERVIGKAIVRVWPFMRIGIVR